MSDHNTSHRPRKRFGQNFLRDTATIHRIIAAIKPKPEDTIIEIGPGEGAITEQLTNCQHLHLIEIDRDLAAELQKKYHEQSHINIHQGDALQLNYANIAEKFRVVGNLPYNISTPLLFTLLNYSQHIIDAHFMLQKEVVERICAQPGSKLYGRLSIVLQSYFEAQHLFNVAPEVFYPVPKVDSAILRLVSRQTPRISRHHIAFQALVKASFAQRRKTLRNNLKNAYGTTQVATLEGLLDLNRRPETLSVDEYILLCNSINDKNN